MRAACLFGTERPLFLILSGTGGKGTFGRLFSRQVIKYLTSALRAEVRFMAFSFLYLSALFVQRRLSYLTIRCLHMPVLPHLGQVSLRLVRVW